MIIIAVGTNKYLINLVIYAGWRPLLKIVFHMQRFIV